MKLLEKGLASWCSAVATCILVAGCHGDTTKGASQSLVTVNGTDITVHQLNLELQQVPAAADRTQQEALQKRTLDALIDRQVVIGAATAAKLDRKPEVMQQIERAKAQILAQAYVQEQIATVAQPSASEIGDFYKKNPELFAHRKLFEVRQLVVPTQTFDVAMKNVVDNATSIEEVAQWLDTHNTVYQRAQSNKTTADLPVQLLSGLDVVAKGKPFVIREPNQVSVLGLKYVKDVPVSAEESTQQIGQFLIQKKRQEALKAEVARLRAAASIAYVDPKLATAQHDKPSPTTSAPVPTSNASTTQDVIKLQ